MDIPHPLRERTRAQLARWAAAMAVFLGIAAALVAGGAHGPLASALASDHSRPAQDSQGVQPEAVLGSEDVPPAGTTDPSGAPEPTAPEPTEPAPDPGPDPGMEPPVGGSPGDDGSTPAEQPNEPPVVDPEPGTGEPGPTEPSDPEQAEPTDPSGAPAERPAAEPAVEPPAPAEPPIGDDASRPPPIDPGNAAGGPPTPVTEDPGQAVEPPTSETPGTSVPPDSAAPVQTRLAEPVARRDRAAERTARFARLTGLPASGGAAGASGGTTAQPAPAAGSGGFQRVGANKKGGDGGVADLGTGGKSGAQPSVVRTVRDIVEVVPDSLKVALAGLAALSVLLGAGYFFSSLRARRLARQRRELLQEVGLLQTALLPPVPERLGALRTSVAYRPADGPGAGGDFYDALPLSGGRVGFILGDVSGHGRGALARTAFMRYTLRAYLEAGLEPRVALQVAGRVIDENLGGDFATVLLAVHDPETGSLTYATAGHPAPIVVGPQPHDPVTASSSPPIGVGERTGLRQTTVPLVPGSVACLFTDGLIEARTKDGVLGRERLTELLDELGPDASARNLIRRAADEARVSADDIAAVVISPTAGVTSGLFRTEQLELSARELEGPIARRFLESCGLSAEEVDEAEAEARKLAERFGGVVLHVVFGNRQRVEVLPRNVESIEAASRRAAAR